VTLAKDVPGASDGWLRRFHAGQRSVLEECYREHFSTVDGAVGQILSGADRETVVHEVFYRLLSDPRMRAGFKGGSLGAWMNTVARNHALNYLRRNRRERPVDPGVAEKIASGESNPLHRATEARLLIERFRSQALPEKWAPVFEARFIRQLSQREAARELGMRRTTLAYQEGRIRALLKRFVSRMEEP
jgi:RNA polymerase sigma-70 factor (ECF subfamily)